MARFERLLIPLLLAIVGLSWFLMRIDAEIVVIVARAVGILLITFLVVGYVVRSVIRLRRARREAEEANFKS